MDRFIVTPQQAIADAIKHLKSNMDRFIGNILIKFIDFCQI